jgi:acetyl/propionyl-CoA carboxylase alpha subunit
MAAATKTQAEAPRSRASQDRPTRRHALVLGWKGAAELIARALGAEGFTTVLESELPPSQRMPKAHGPAAADAARAALQRFVASAPKEASLYIHPGVSPWSERPVLQTLGHELRIEAIGPPARALAFFSNRLNLIAEAEKSGIANLVQTFEPVHSVREISKLVKASGLRFPFLLKSAHGGGAGRYLAREEEDLERRLELWIEQVRRSSGEVILFPERYVEGARYVVQPFARFMSGHFETFPSYDASLQSRYRKILSFCPCQSIDQAVSAKIVEWTRKLAEQCGFVGVGTLEYMVDGDRPYLVEGAARLDTNFHLWEKVAGTSAVAWQLAAQDPRTQAPPARSPREDSAAGLCLRVLAEDSMLQLPQPGRVHEVCEKTEWSFPGASAELSISIAPGEEVAPEDSGLIAALWVFGRDATQALTVARGVLEELWVTGSLQTNERFLSELINHPWVRAGLFHAGFVEEEFLPAIRPPEDVFHVLSALGPLATGGAEPPEGHSERWSVGDQWVRPSSRPIEWVSGPEDARVAGHSAVSGRVKLPDGRTVRVSAFPLGPGRWQARVGHWTLPLRRVLKPETAKGRAALKPKVLALVPGRVHSILYREGGVVPAHEPFLVIESLGMLVPHALPKEVRIQKWRVAAEDSVQAGQELADFEVLA